MTQFPDLFAALAAPFTPAEVKSKTESGGRQARYITARTAMNRFDTVLGPENWWDRYVPGEKSVLCELTIRLPDGSILTKSDAGGYAGLSDSGDDDKSGYSDAYKRAAVKFGVARYLYRDGVPRYKPGDETEAPEPQPEPPRGPRNNGHANGRDREYARNGRENGHGHSNNGNGNGRGRRDPDPAALASPPTRPQKRQPANGRELFEWAKKSGHELGVDLLGMLKEWGESRGIGGRAVAWGADDVAEAYEETQRFTASTERAGESNMARRSRRSPRGPGLATHCPACGQPYRAVMVCDDPGCIHSAWRRLDPPAPPKREPLPLFPDPEPADEDRDPSDVP